MKKEMNNKGFSLVELIIVVAIMAVLIGVLAPAYLQYVEKSKKTKDCGAVGSIMDACEIVAGDPAITWDKNEAITISVDSDDATYTPGAVDAAVTTKLDEIVAESKTKLAGSWGTITFTATKEANGTVVFSNTTTGTDAMINSEIAKISPELEARFN
jgi:type IV pilus assembly protein PilA